MRIGIPHKAMKVTDGQTRVIRFTWMQNLWLPRNLSHTILPIFYGPRCDPVEKYIPPSVGCPDVTVGGGPGKKKKQKILFATITESHTSGKTSTPTCYRKNHLLCLAVDTDQNIGNAEKTDQQEKRIKKSK